MRNFLLGVAAGILMCLFVVQISHLSRKLDAINQSVGHGQFQKSDISDPYAEFGGKRIDPMTVGECDALKDGRNVTVTAVYANGTFNAKDGCAAKGKN